MNSPFSTLLIALQARLKTLVPELKWIDQELGQLEQERPTVAFPCALIDFNEWSYEDASEAIQFASGVVSLRLAFPAWSNTNDKTATLWKEKGLAFYDLEWRIYQALHGWKPTLPSIGGVGGGYGYMMRMTTNTEEREDNIRVRVLRFSCNFEDFSAQPQYQRGTPSEEIEFTALPQI